MTSIDLIASALADVVDSGVLKMAAATAWTRDAAVFEGAAGEGPAGRAMTPDTIVWIASMTKAVTVVSALQLVERGHMELDEPLTRETFAQ